MNGRWSRFVCEVECCCICLLCLVISCSFKSFERLKTAAGEDLSPVSEHKHTNLYVFAQGAVCVRTMAV
jgi:hypothetical protein